MSNTRLKQHPKKELQERHGERQGDGERRKVIEVTRFFIFAKEEVKLYGY